MLSPKYLCLLVLLFIGDTHFITEPFTAKVIGVQDGDTIKVLKGKKTFVIRLADIDCPEKKQPFGNVAKKFTSDLCFGKEVRIIPTRKPDRYKRIIATVWIDTISLTKELVKSGLAWHFTNYSKDPLLAKLEQQARANKQGLWKDQNPTPPWEWRQPKKAAVQDVLPSPVIPLLVLPKLLFTYKAQSSVCNVTRTKLVNPAGNCYFFVKEAYETKSNDSIMGDCYQFFFLQQIGNRA